MQVHNVIQGSPEWAALRAQHFCASEAPAMMGASPYLQRTQLLQQKKTGIAPDIDAPTQRRFDDGHAAEDAFRPIAEQIINEDLYPVTGSREVEGLPLLASFDGLTMGWDVGYEHKLYNAELARQILEDGEPGPAYYWQLEHQLLVSQATKILFVTSNGEEAGSVQCVYQSRPERRAQLIAGWKQFSDDLAAYVVPEVVDVVAPTPVESLPAVTVRVEGQLAIVSNLDVFGQRLRAFVEGIDKNPSTDQAFADAENACKVLQKAQDALEQAETYALSQTADIEQLRRTVADYAGLARSTRLMLEKVVKTRKEQIKVEIVTEGQQALAEHVRKLNARIGKPYMPAIAADFPGCIKGKKTVSSMREAVNVTLTNAKLQANETADLIQANLHTLQREAIHHAFLFHDTPQLVLKPADHVELVIRSRIAEHKAAEEKKLEAERERIREEERVRAEREAQAKAAVEERERATAAAARATESLDPPPEKAWAPPPPPAPTLVDQPTPVASASPPRTLKVSEISALLGFNVTAALLAELGFQPVNTEGVARPYRATDFPLICSALIRRINTAAALYVEAA